MQSLEAHVKHHENVPVSLECAGQRALLQEHPNGDTPDLQSNPGENSEGEVPAAGGPHGPPAAGSRQAKLPTHTASTGRRTSVMSQPPGHFSGASQQKSCGRGDSRPLLQKASWLRRNPAQQTISNQERLSGSSGGAFGGDDTHQASARASGQEVRPSSVLAESRCYRGLRIASSLCPRASVWGAPAHQSLALTFNIYMPACQSVPRMTYARLVRLGHGQHPYVIGFSTLDTGASLHWCKAMKCDSNGISPVVSISWFSYLDISYIAEST